MDVPGLSSDSGTLLKVRMKYDSHIIAYVQRGEMVAPMILMRKFKITYDAAIRYIKHCEPKKLTQKEKIALLKQSVSDFVSRVNSDHYQTQKAFNAT